MKHLTRSERNELQQLLLEEKRAIQKQFAGRDNFQMAESHSESMTKRSTYDNHPAGIGTELFERGKDLAFNNEFEKHLLDVEAALALFDKGEYGTCAVCGKAIPFERLQAVPSTAFCTEHAPDRHVMQERGMEEHIWMPPFGADELPELHHFDGEYPWQMVARSGTPDSPVMSEDPEVHDYNNNYSDNDEDDGFTSDRECFIAAAIPQNDVYIVRNPAYYDYLMRGEGEPMIDPDPPDRVAYR